MSFTTRFTFSTNYRSLGSVWVPSYGAQPVSSAASVYAGARGSNSRISVMRSASFRSGMGVREQIWEHLEKKGLQVRDWGHYFKTIEDLRAQIFADTVDNALIVLQIDNAYETELAMRQFVESDIHGLCKVTDDTNVTQLQVETEIEALKEELLFMKNHEEELWVDRGGRCPKSQDLAKIMAEIRAQYDELARKNREELDKYWTQLTEESTTIVTTQSTEVEAAEMTLTELRRTV
ncbi:Keratin, type I cytoskeletal 18 [Saguinus oedipus]|uniref:Keratin, type I cytoskeletal 18 n=1 Tax=Saguinus oedipus TaxID=9490 RepID=A0ABQ9TJT4_SAGOE|nr:Keratin, type I cytoskeletal 18 [Saguinus oedipus]